MKTLWCKNQENPSDRISHAWAPLNLQGRHVKGTENSCNLLVKGTVLRDRFRKLTDLGLNKGRGWFLNFSEAPLIFG